MIDLLRPQCDFNLWFARNLVTDVPDDQMSAQPIQGQVINHPAFLLGHVAWADDNALKMLGVQPPAAAAEINALCAQGTKPLSDRSKYPSKDAMLKYFEEAQGRLVAAIAKAKPETLAQPTPERMRAMFPTVHQMLLGLLTGHTAFHLGQISAWRRAMGMPPVF